MIHLGIPVMGQKQLTRKCLEYMDQSVSDPSQLHVIVIDNASEDPYTREDLGATQFKITLIRNQSNTGFYQPLAQVRQYATVADLVGLQHNDLFHYEPGWTARCIRAFISDSHLGLIGVCGSPEIDDRGGRGGGTCCNFRGYLGQRQSDTGRRETGLCYALILDSMFMLYRYPLVDFLDIDKHTSLCHFYDKLHPLKVMDAGWRVAVLGLEVDHIGGQTAVLEGKRFEKDAEVWCRQEGITFKPGEASLALYLESERRFLEYGRRRGYVPSKIR